MLGADAFWESRDEIQVGAAGIGVLEVSGGALVQCGAAIIGAGEVASGDATVTGLDTLWSCSRSLIVGGEGLAGLVIEDGAMVTCERSVVARQIGSLADAVVRGAGTTWDVAGTLDVGMRGVASLLVEDGAFLRSTNFATIGTFPDDMFGGEGGVGTVTVRGPGSGWLVEGDLHVGYLSSGTLVLSRGGAVDVDGDLLRAVGDGTTRIVIEFGGADDYPTPALRAGGITDDFDPIVRLVDGFVPRSGDLFEIAFAEAGAGTFSFTLPDLPNALEWLVIADAGRVALEVVSPCGPADIDGDGVVGFTDVLAVLGAWGSCEGCPEDLDGNGLVDFADILLVLADWGACK